MLFVKKNNQVKKKSTKQGTLASEERSRQFNWKPKIKYSQIDLRLVWFHGRVHSARWVWYVVDWEKTRAVRSYTMQKKPNKSCVFIVVLQDDNHLSGRVLSVAQEVRIFKKWIGSEFLKNQIILSRGGTSRFRCTGRFGWAESSFYLIFFNHILNVNLYFVFRTGSSLDTEINNI